MINPIGNSVIILSIIKSGTAETSASFGAWGFFVFK